MCVAVPIAEWAVEYPHCERPEIRSAIVVVQREIKDDAQKSGPAKGDGPLAALPDRNASGDAPEDEAVIGAENPDPSVREIELSEHNFRGHAQNEQVPDAQNIERQIGKQCAKESGGRDFPRVWPGKSGGAENQVCRSVHSAFPMDVSQPIYLS